ncbi:cupin domain-containing protein [Azospirillum sp. ST 5-10]|uniref:cupin domain-containing protein n=1 Tax=unclassified Azospirillum TaxID=2630922 RepID=UPI003F4A54ED
MIPILAFFSAIAAAAAAGAAEPRPMSVSCEVLLPAGPIPGDPGYFLTVERLTVPPGHDAHRHVHAAPEYLTVLSGTGTLTIDGQGDVALRPGVVVAVPPDVRHQQHNASAAEPLVYTATFVGRIDEPRLTAYVGEPDKTAGCPHRREPAKP